MKKQIYLFIYGLILYQLFCFSFVLVKSEAEDMAKRVVIIGISGRGGDDGEGGGINETIQKLKSRLNDYLGIPSENIFYKWWQNDSVANEDPWGAPDTSEHLQQIFEKASEPIYVAIIGHSYGGWAASKLSRAFETATRRKPDYVALIDPVFGAWGDFEPRISPSAIKVDNWYQRNSIISINNCSSPISPSYYPTVGCETNNGISCGRPVDGANNFEEEFIKNEYGKKEEEWCSNKFPHGKVYRFEYHTHIDQNAWIRTQIINNIENDLVHLLGDPLERIYWEVLGRAIDPGGRDTWNAVLLNGTSLADVRHAVVYDPGGEVKSKVAEIYQEILGHDWAEGWDAWAPLLAEDWSLIDVQADITKEYKSYISRILPPILSLLQ